MLLSYKLEVHFYSFEIPLLYQLFKHSVLSIFSGPSNILSHVIIQRPLENTLSGSSLIPGIKRISIANRERRGPSLSLLILTPPLKCWLAFNIVRCFSTVIIVLIF